MEGEGGRKGGREGGREGGRTVFLCCVILHSSVFQENSGANGIISVGYSPMKFLGNNTFLANTGTALRVSGDGRGGGVMGEG